MTYTISRSPFWRWLLALFGATEGRSQVRLHPDALDVQCGPFHERIALGDLEEVAVAHRQLPWWRYSLGWRTDLLGRVALVGAPANLVRLTLASRRWVRLFPGVRVPCRELLVSLEAPDDFVRAVEARRRAA
jgi:hypothetical protein